MLQFLKTLSFSFLFFLALPVLAQDSLKQEQVPDFITIANDTIANSNALQSFFNKLQSIKKEKRQISIVHIGDSHIQADFLTNTVRSLLQTVFGNAGRGLVFPGRIGHTNEPMNIFSSSKSAWEGKRIVFTDNPLPIGIGAMTIRTIQPDSKFMLRIKNNPQLNYAFENLNVFFQKDSLSYNVLVKDSTGNALAYLGAYANDGHKNLARIRLPYKTNYLEFEAKQSSKFENQFSLFGVSATNQSPGIVYHAIGGNGAKFKHYLSADYFFEQTPELEPDLFIISLGTNEASEHPYIDKKLAEQIEVFLSNLRIYNPDVPVLVTTPLDFYKKKTRRNPGVEEVRTTLLEIVDKKKLAVWDLYEIGGGKHSADKWRKNELLQKDGIHATRRGYELQGKLLFDALMNSYQKYVQHRHP